MHLFTWPLRQARRASTQFSETEAWQLFRLAAFAEAIGWTLLIIGILVTTYVTPGNRDAVIIAGQLHGTIFFGYLVAAILFSFRLSWSPLTTLLAIAASVPPYGSLVFELIINNVRSQRQARDFYYNQLFKSFPSQARDDVNSLV